MAVRNLSHLISLLALRGEIIHTLDQLRANPHTQGHIAAFEGLRDEWGVVFAEELALRDSLSATNARVYTTDAGLNALASRVSKAILTLTGDDRTHPLYFAYFKKKSLSDFKRPILGTQLEAMRGWVPELKKSDEPVLSALGGEVEAAVIAADEAVSARTLLEAGIAFFREAGGRKKFFDKANALRKQSHGELAKMSYEKLGLPASFANLFFRHESAGSGGDEEPVTVETIDAEIMSLEAQIAEKKALKAEIVAAIEQQAKAEAQKAAEQAALAELERAAAEAMQKVAAAKAKLAAKQQSPSP
jgi:hypothetical protein